MTNKEVRKLKKPDLLEILYYLQQENEELKQENEKLRSQIDSFTSGMSFPESELQKIKDAVTLAVKDAMNQSSAQESKSQKRKEA